MEGEGEFFVQDSVCKMIDYQYRTTFKVFNFLFWFYIILF